MNNNARVTGINGSVVTIEFDKSIRQGEVVYIIVGKSELKAEVIKIKDNFAQVQVFESTKGVKVGNQVRLTGELLSVELGPGLLGMLYDGLQNPLESFAREHGQFLSRGHYLSPLDREQRWKFEPMVEIGNHVIAGDFLGTVDEKIFKHKVMVPFHLSGKYRIKYIVPSGEYTVDERVAVLEDDKFSEISLTMSFHWPVKQAVEAYKERLLPEQPLQTKVRIIDTFFPVAMGGTYCIPGPFGAGKTVLQQITSRHASVDIVIFAACGERASEIVDTINEFPKLIDPRTGKSLMERTIIICNTSSMPVAARESSVYTAVTIAEYYRQMGLQVLLLADSTSRWAQALRERSARLEEIPGEEAFPAYLESVIASFYERAGMVRLNDGTTGSVTIGGTVSPAGGNFEEPVTQATLKVVGAFHALSQERADSHRYPSIDALESWSNYRGIVEEDRRKQILSFFTRANEINQMMMVVGEEGISLQDYTIYLKSELIDDVYLQQNAFDPVDVACGQQRQTELFVLLWGLVETHFDFADKEACRSFFQNIRQKFLDYNGIPWDDPVLQTKKNEISGMIKEESARRNGEVTQPARSLFVESDFESSFRKSGKSIKNPVFTGENGNDSEGGNDS